MLKHLKKFINEACYKCCHRAIYDIVKYDVLLSVAEILQIITRQIAAATVISERSLYV